jgi:hypothetical protein
MTRRTQTAQEAISELYAVLASASARRAISRISEWGDTAGADALAETTAKWLDKSSAKAIRWVYRRPSLPS